MLKNIKIGCIFYTIGNIHPKYRSTYRTIFLSTVVNITLVERHCINAVLTPLVNELNELSESEIEIIQNE